MHCHHCRHRIVMPAFSKGICQSCGKELVCTNTPPDVLCQECADSEKRCQHCGRQVEADDKNG